MYNDYEYSKLMCIGVKISKISFVFLNRIFAYFLFFPVLLIAIYDLTVGHKPRDLRIAIINEEIPLDDCHLRDLGGICLFDNINEKYFSCRFVDELRNNFKVVSNDCIF